MIVGAIVGEFNKIALGGRHGAKIVIKSQCHFDRAAGVWVVGRKRNLYTCKVGMTCV